MKKPITKDTGEDWSILNKIMEETTPKDYFIDILNKKVVINPSWRIIINQYKGLPNFCKENNMDFDNTYSLLALQESGKTPNLLQKCLEILKNQNL